MTRNLCRLDLEKEKIEWTDKLISEEILVGVGGCRSVIKTIEAQKN